MKEQVIGYISHPFRTIKNIVTDMKVGGIPLGGSIKTKYADEGAKNTTNSGYDQLEEVFSKIDITEDDVLVDIGCGKGRVLGWWLLNYPGNQIIGLELDPNIARFTSRRLRKYKNVRIIAGDAIENLPCEGTVFYMFNPFNEVVTRRLKVKFEKMHMVNAQIVYLNSAHINVFESDSKWKVTRVHSNSDKIHVTHIVSMM